MSTKYSHLKSSLGKRKFDKAFADEEIDDARYNNHISSDYFEKGGIGHGVFQEEPLTNDPELNKKIQETYLWCLEYLKTKQMNPGN